MATFGSTINPSLGRTDYSAYTQGAAQAAQGVANAGETMGRAYSQVGDTIGKAIMQYQQNKLITDQAMGKVMGSLAGNKRMQDVIYQGNVPADVKKALDKVAKGKNPSLNEATLLSSYIDTVQTGLDRQDAVEAKNMQLYQQQRELEMKNTQIQNEGKLINFKIDPNNAKAAPFNDRQTAYNNAITAARAAKGGSELSPDEIDDISRRTLLPQAQPQFGNLQPGQGAFEDRKTGVWSVKQIGDNPAETKKAEQLGDANALINQTIGNLDELDRVGGMVNVDKTADKNVMAYLKSSGIGQELQRIVGTKEQSVRDQINSATNLIVQDYKNVMGMSASQMSSNMELKAVMDAVKPGADIKTAKQALVNLQKRYNSDMSGHKNGSNASGLIPLSPEAQKFFTP